MKERRVGVVEATKAKPVAAEGAQEFWEGKTPCWEMCHCPPMIREDCPAPKYRFLPCWQIEGTYCKLDDYGATGRDTSICELCRVYKKWGDKKPIELKLFGRGIDTQLRGVEKLTEKAGAESK